MSIKTNDEPGGGPGQRLGHQHHRKQRHNCQEMTAKQAEWDRWGNRPVGVITRPTHLLVYLCERMVCSSRR